jgi:hypothetical protein
MGHGLATLSVELTQSQRWAKFSNRYFPVTNRRTNSLQIVYRSSKENCAVLGYYAASSGNFVPTFRDNLSVPSSKGQESSMFSSVLLPHRLEFFPPETSFLTAALTTLPLSHPPPPTVLAGTTLVRIYHRPHSSLYKLRARATGFFFFFWILDPWRCDLQVVP